MLSLGSTGTLLLRNVSHRLPKMVRALHTNAYRCYRWSTMAKRVIVIILVVLVVVGVTSYAYSHYRDRRIEAGEVVDESGTTVGSSGSGQAKSSSASDGTDGGPDDGSAHAVRRSNSPLAAKTTVVPVQNAMSAAPVADTIAPNPPNGMVFAGTGKFQVYRQGDLTWRVNTADGSTCILFATEEQWRKPVVYRNGCSRG
jgi:hypothetical protein